jgi:hypothetical protein
MPGVQCHIYDRSSATIHSATVPRDESACQNRCERPVQLILRSQWMERVLLSPLSLLVGVAQPPGQLS